MKLKCLASGSSGNCYLIESDNDVLILDCGIPIRDIKIGLDFDLSKVVGVCVTHSHADHSKSVEDFRKMGIPVFAPYESLKPMSFRNWSGTVQAFDLTDLNGKFMHTNADGSECPCYGFLITHPDMGRLLYITDTEFVKWRFKNINHILVSCNYQKKYIAEDENSGKKTHVLRGHMELETVKEFVKANNSNAIRNVILCHLSQDNAEPLEMVAEVKKIVGNGVYVNYARKGLEIELSRTDKCPF